MVPSWVRKVGRWGVFLVSTILLVAVLLWFAGAFEEKIPPGEQPLTARTHAGEPVSRVHLVRERVIETSVGTVQPAQHTEISSLIPATIREIRVNAGSVVSQGDVLVILDSRDLQARVDQARQAVTAAEADARRAAAELNRYRGLMDQSVVSQSEFDGVESAARVAAAEVERAQRALEEALVGLTHAEIAAPIDGQVVDRLAEPGDRANPGAPLLTLYNPAVLRLEAPVREGLATTLQVGQPLLVHIDALNLDLGGAVDQIVPQSEIGSRSMLVKVRLPPTQGLYRGMFGRLQIPAGERDRLCLDARAIEAVGQLEFVHVVREDGGIERRLVVTGEHGEGGMVEVLSGLASGETVVLGE